MAQIIDGRKLADEIQADIAKEIYDKHLRPNLAVVLVGDDPASHLYVNKKKEACAKVGIEFHGYNMDQNSTTEQVLETVNFLNKDENIDAILVQLPLPDQIDTDKIIEAIDPAKDVDGFHRVTVQKLLSGQPSIVPGLPLGIIKLLESTGENLSGKKCVVIANSDEFFTPLSKLLTDKGISTTLTRPENKDVKEISAEADILIVACGRAFFVRADMVKSNAIVIDVGTNKVGDHTVGDVDFSEVFEKASWITPVPGGVGPMTVGMLLYNTVQLAKAKNK